MRDSLERAARALKRVASVTVATHVDPDGDAIGSLLGIALILKGMGKKVVARWQKNMTFPPQYEFLPGREMISELPGNADAFVVLDCGSFNRLGDLVAEAKRHPHLINIDHHPDNDLFGTINVVEGRASSTSEMVYDFAKLAKAEIGKQAALCLYVGLLTDTGKFQYSNTTARSHLIAADLIGEGRIDVADTFCKVYEQLSFGSLKLLASVISGAVLRAESGLVYSVATRKLIDETGGKLEELENLIDHLRSVKSADVAALAKELPDGRFRISLRSKGEIDVSKIAREHGGGGHKNAAAFVADGSLIENISMIEDAVRGQKREIDGWSAGDR